MLKREKDGATRLEHLQAVSGRVEVPELKYPEPDDSITYVLNHFYHVKQAQGVKISYTELRNYSELMSYQLSSWECELIMRIDTIYERCLHG